MLKTIIWIEWWIFDSAELIVCVENSQCENLRIFLFLLYVAHLIDRVGNTELKNIGIVIEMYLFSGN